MRWTSRRVASRGAPTSSRAAGMATGPPPGDDRAGPTRPTVLVSAAKHSLCQSARLLWSTLPSLLYWPRGAATRRWRACGGMAWLAARTRIGRGSQRVEAASATTPDSPPPAGRRTRSLFGARPSSGLGHAATAGAGRQRHPHAPPAARARTAAAGADAEPGNGADRDDHGRESAVNGSIRSEHSIRIQGGAEGEIECARSVYVEEGARVDAKIAPPRSPFGRAKRDRVLQRSRGDQADRYGCRGRSTPLPHHAGRRILRRSAQDEEPRPARRRHDARPRRVPPPRPVDAAAPVPPGPSAARNAFES